MLQLGQSRREFIMKRMINHSIPVRPEFLLIALCGFAFVFTASGCPALGLQNGVAGTATPESRTIATKGHDASYVIGNSDVLAITVWKEPDVSRSIPVRPDGKISLPLVGEIQATGRTPLQLEEEITAKLQTYINKPEVTVIVQEINSEKFNILGRVVKPGSYPLSGAATVLDAIAAAGGFQDFAKQKSIYVLRSNPAGGQSRMAFNYKDVVKGKHPEQNIKLEPRDTIVVP
jgi:polysaccharide biosynthesis/export protein